MRILLATDNTIGLNTSALADRLNVECRYLKFAGYQHVVRIPDPTLTNPYTYDHLDPGLVSAARDFDLAIIGTFCPYGNNYFFDFAGSIGIVSFSGWNVLTDLPVVNGFVYFVTAILARRARLGDPHDENTGCLNDHWWDKSGVDVGMRAAFICRNCRAHFVGNPAALNDMQRLLDLVSLASRTGVPLDAPPVAQAAAAPFFDTFLCHNADDKSQIRPINSALRLAGVVTWFDEEQLKAGQVWQVELENQIEQIRSACVFLGPSGKGPWQEIEIRAILSEFAERGCAVIPVILPGAPPAPKLPLFLRSFSWVDLRPDFEAGIGRIVDAVASR